MMMKAMRQPKLKISMLAKGGMMTMPVPTPADNMQRVQAKARDSAARPYAGGQYAGRSTHIANEPLGNGGEDDGIGGAHAYAEDHAESQVKLPQGTALRHEKNTDRDQYAQRQQQGRRFEPVAHPAGEDRDGGVDDVVEEIGGPCLGPRPVEIGRQLVEEYSEAVLCPVLYHQGKGASCWHKFAVKMVFTVCPVSYVVVRR